MVIDAAEGFVLAGTAVSGEDALAFLASHPVDLIVIDLHMEGRSGVDTARTYADRIKLTARPPTTLNSPLNRIRGSASFISV